MAANLITLLRVCLAFLVVLMFQGDMTLRIAAVLLTLIVIYMDSLDGIIARRMGITSDFGALFDITGDRIVEHVYWIFFAVIGLVSIWVAIIFISRSFIVDTLRAVAMSKHGKTPFGEKSMMRSPLTFFLTASRTSRAIYGVAKVLVFMCLGCLLVLDIAPLSLTSGFPAGMIARFEFFTSGLVWLVVAMNIVRGLPVIWDGRFYLVEKTA